MPYPEDEVYPEGWFDVPTYEAAPDWQQDEQETANYLSQQAPGAPAYEPISDDIEQYAAQERAWHEMLDERTRQIGRSPGFYDVPRGVNMEPTTYMPYDAPYNLPAFIQPYRPRPEWMQAIEPRYRGEFAKVPVLIGDEYFTAFPPQMGVTGYYDPQGRYIAVRDPNDLTTVTHEYAHAFEDKRFPGAGWEAWDRIVNRFADAVGYGRDPNAWHRYAYGPETYEARQYPQWYPWLNRGVRR